VRGLYTLAIAPLLFFAVFWYPPMIGNVIAFRQYLPGGPLFGVQWVGFYYIDQLRAQNRKFRKYEENIGRRGMTSREERPSALFTCAVTQCSQADGQRDESPDVARHLL
jgi:hypothetical protein